MSTTSTPRSARFDLPSAPPYSSSTPTDNGLAEWATKIKAMQRQVDADDEAEQRRLEEEIMRARLARMRRSKTGQSGDFGVGMHGIDLSKVQDASSRNGETDAGTTSSEKQPPSNVSFPKPAIKSASSTGTKAAPISLAAFMGGSASGPRLRRHEPQADASAAYDGRVEHGLVHPVFGRGGVAMPGMVAREVAAVPPSPSLSSASTSQPIPTSPRAPTSIPPTIQSEQLRSRTMSTSFVARRYVEKLEEQSATSSQPSTPKVSGLGIRERRKSTPHGGFSELEVVTPPMLSRPVSQNLGVRATSPDPRFRSRSPTADVRPKTPSAELRPKTPVTEYRAKTPSEEPRAKTPGADNTRAKTPIQSSPTRTNLSGTAPWQTPRHQPSTQLSSTSASTIPPKSPGPPSPVRATHAPQPQRGVPPFLRPPVLSSSKDPTPSISRLHGRGFVQSIVQASDRLGNDPQGSPSTAPKYVFPSTSPIPPQGSSEMREKGARRGSVLDRWTPVLSGTNGTPSPPLPSSKSTVTTRSHTTQASAKPSQGQEMSSVKTHDTGRSVRSAVSLPVIPKTPHKKSEGLPFQGPQDKKLGSSSTMISYIKPTKTGDDPITPDVDELGIKASDGGVGGGSGTSAANYGGLVGGPGRAKTPKVAASPLPASPGKPLSHVRPLR